MKKSNKKVIVYIVSLLYIATGIGVLCFGDFVIHNSWGAIFLFLLLPGTLISTAFGFFVGKIGLTVGVLITILLTVYIIERVFKKTHPTNLPS